MATGYVPWPQKSPKICFNDSTGMQEKKRHESSVAELRADGVKEGKDCNIGTICIVGQSVILMWV